MISVSTAITKTAINFYCSSHLTYYGLDAKSEINCVEKLHCTNYL